MFFLRRCSKGGWCVKNRKSKKTRTAANCKGKKPGKPEKKTEKPGNPEKPGIIPLWGMSTELGRGGGEIMYGFGESEYSTLLNGESESQ